MLQRHSSPWFALFALTGTALACSSSAIESDREPKPPVANPDGSMPDPKPTPKDLGMGDGTLASVTLTELYAPKLRVPLSATALAFNAAIPDELWVLLRQFPSGMPCSSTDDSGCAALPGAVAVLGDATGAAPTATLKEDGNSLHFMRRPTALAWSDSELFASCGEAWTDNLEDAPVPYAGPVLWSSDPTVFGVTPKATQNGTHLDMLHATPYCMGIAHESANIYWAFNGDVGALDRYDFHAPHQIGGEDHMDGEVHRYVTGQLLREPEVPSHMAYDAKSGLVYVADTGHGRIVSVDPKPATAGGAITTYESLAASGEMVGAKLTELVPPGLLQKPSGLALHGEVLYVTDNASSIVYAFDLAGELLSQLPTELPSGTLAGIAVGPDDQLYFTDQLTGAVRRIDPN
ncbi:MAG TPA: hypothetical protein VIW29_02545 [Polyangiaceae bacterium]